MTWGLRALERSKSAPVTEARVRQIIADAGGGGGGGPVAWGDVTGKPATFPPEVHTHPASAIQDSTTPGRALLTAADAAAQRTAMVAQETLVSGTNIKTVNGNSLLGSGNISISGGGAADTFETVNKNLAASGATLNYSGGELASIVYAIGITKTLSYGVDGLESVVLSGSTPGGIALSKTLIYTSGELTGVVYS